MIRKNFVQQTEKAYAKLNLTLDILGRREDGYHDLSMVMQSISLCDNVTIAPGDGLQVKSNLHYLPVGRKNLAAIAVERFYDGLGQSAPGMEITLEKRIPVCAGMAGGSSDAAAVLRLLNCAEEMPYTREKLKELAEKIGSDVPYCLMGGTALAEGRGERLTPLPAMPDCWIVTCKPKFSISTPELFARADQTRIAYHPDTAGMIAALKAGNLKDIAYRLFNVFEDVLPDSQRSEVREIKQALIDAGALGASMSGSGPSTFGIFAEEEAAQLAANLLQQQYRDTFLAKPV